MVIHLFGDRLRELRKSKNISQEELGHFCRVAKNTVSNWENNINQPSYEILTKLAQHFGVTIDYLLGFNQEDIDALERLKTALKEAGMWDYDIDDMSKEDFEKAMQIMNMLKDKK